MHRKRSARLVTYMGNTKHGLRPLCSKQHDSEKVKTKNVLKFACIAMPTSERVASWAWFPVPASFSGRAGRRAAWGKSHVGRQGCRATESRCLDGLSQNSMV